jgi:hypothetical protein
LVFACFFHDSLSIFILMAFEVHRERHDDGDGNVKKGPHYTKIMPSLLTVAQQEDMNRQNPPVTPELLIAGWTADLI